MRLGEETMIYSSLGDMRSSQFQKESSGGMVQYVFMKAFKCLRLERGPCCIQDSMRWSQSQEEIWVNGLVCL